MVNANSNADLYHKLVNYANLGGQPRIKDKKKEEKKTMEYWNQTLQGVYRLIVYENNEVKISLMIV